MSSTQVTGASSGTLTPTRLAQPFAVGDVQWENDGPRETGPGTAHPEERNHA